MRYKMAIEKINGETIETTRVIISAEPYSDFKYGSRVVVVGALELPENFETDTGKTFDYVSYLKKDRIFYVINKPAIKVVAIGEGNKVYTLLFAIKQAFIRNLNEIIPFPESRLAAGLTVAGKKALPQNVQEDFMKSGTMQVVVLSGYNVTIIAETFAMILSKFPKIIASTTGGIGIVLFTIMAGASATIVRGSVMALLVLIAGLYGRQYNINRSLIATAVVMLLHNPMLLVYDPSFQLSFLSTIGLIHFSPVFEKYFEWVTERFQFRSATVATVSTQIFVTPFLIFGSGEISSVAVGANLLVFLLSRLRCFLLVLPECLHLFHTLSSCHLLG